MVSKSDFFGSIMTKIPSSVASTFSRWYAPALVSELSKLESARADWIQVGENIAPCLHIEGGITIVGESPSPYEEGILGPILEKMGLPTSHTRVAIDYVIRYLHPHMAIATDRIKFAKKARRFYHPQHFNLLQEVESIGDETKKLVESLFRPSKYWSVVDVGCYLGYGSLWMSGLVHDGKVISVEAVRNNYAIASANKDLSNVTNWELINAAIWDDEHQEISISLSSRQGNAIDDSVVGGGSHEVVPTVSIASLTQRCGCPIDLLSLTVNGAEVEAIKGMKSMKMEDLPKRILTPGWYSLNGVKRYEIIEPILRDMGYKFVTTPGMFTLAWLPDIEE